MGKIPNVEKRKSGSEVGGKVKKSKSKQESRGLLPKIITCKQTRKQK
jgi:hypothetical protein